MSNPWGRFVQSFGKCLFLSWASSSWDSVLEFPHVVECITGVFFHRIALVMLLCTHLYQCICNLIPIFVFLYIISSMQSFEMYIPADWAKNTFSTPFLHETKSPFLPRLEAVDVLHSRGHAVLNLEGIDRQAALDAARRIWDSNIFGRRK